MSQSLDDTSVGRRLRRLRQERGLRQADVAGDGISVAYVSMIEHGRRTPSDRVIAVLASRLGVDPAEFADRITEAQPPAMTVGAAGYKALVELAGDASASSALTQAASALLLLGQAERALRSAESVVTALLRVVGEPSAVELSQAHLVSAQAHLALNEHRTALGSIRSAREALQGTSDG
jgi:transcriptional regulator with XRE-family HTH domain